MPDLDTSSFPTISGFRLVEHLGGGGFASVYKAIDKTGVIAACKVIAMNKATPDKDRKVINKEIQVHSALVHENIIRMKDALILEDDGSSKFIPGAYLLLEMAHGGDLFDKIAPDVGVNDDLAHYYMDQLVSGLGYIHGQGICHRDLKPENLLLSINGILKLCDFGLCAVFRYKGTTRKLKDRCGSLPYIAPELAYEGAYDAPPVDIWGAGIIMFTLLVGSTPWDEATTSSPEFMAYLNGSIWAKYPWSKIGEKARDLLQLLMAANPSERPSIDQVRGHLWFARQSQFATQSAGDMAQHLTQSLRDAGDMDIAQPDVFTDADGDQIMATAPGTAFTQSLQFFTQLPNGIRHSPHLTRFFVSIPAAGIFPLILQALQAIGVKTKDKPTTLIALGGYDARKERFKGRISIEQFTWKERECCFVEMAREEGNPISWRQLWKMLVQTPTIQVHVLLKGPNY